MACLERLRVYRSFHNVLRDYKHLVLWRVWNVYTGRFIMFSVITNIYNKKTKGPALMELLTRVWQQLEYRIDVCRVTRCAHIEHL